jgi:phage protein D
MNLIGAQYPDKRPPEIVIEAEDAFQELRMKERTRTFEDVSDEDIIQQIASEYGLSAEINLDSPIHSRVKQLNQSDFSFLLDRVRAAGGVMWMEPNKLIVKKDIDALANPEELEYGAALKQFVVQGDLRNQCTSVGVAGWDIRSKTPIRHSATDDVLDTENRGKTGGRALEEAFGQRLQTLVHDMPDSHEEAEHMAETYYREKAEQFVTGIGIAEPLPGLHVGRTVDIRGVGKLFEGTYAVTQVRHCFDTTEGLRTEFNVRRAWIGEIRQIIKVKNHAGNLKRKKRKSAAKK